MPATCFPPAAGLSSSWNPELIHKVGEAMAEECIQEKVAVILGPGVNIKRNPLGGRCFEYWSEDPYLAGHEAVGIVAGVQSKGVGTSLKHFAANNQETDRLRVSAPTSPSGRCARSTSRPSSTSSRNRPAMDHHVRPTTASTACMPPRTAGCSPTCSATNGGMQGIVMSDWGADHDRVASLNAGLNLEMPPSYTDDQIVYAARDGRIQPAQLDRMAQGMVDLVNKTRAAMSVDDYRFDVDAHDEVAHQAAVESMVLLKNDDAILPVAGERQGRRHRRIRTYPALPGRRFLAHHPDQDDQLPRRPRRARRRRRVRTGLHPRPRTGRSARSKPKPSKPPRAPTSSSCSSASLEAAESEGFDRETLDMPAKQVALLEAVAAENKNVVVVLSNGLRRHRGTMGRATPRASSNPGCLARRAVRRSPTCSSAR